MSGQSVIDRLNAAKHSLSGQGLAKAVCKASTEEVIGPKRKHLDYLLQCTHEANVSVPQLADLIIQRAQSTNWVVVFKSLVTAHNIMNYGNERFYQYLASNNCAFHLENFIDKAHPQGYDMSTYIRKYARYINEKSMAYRVMAFDFCKVKRGKEDGLLRTMSPEKLLKALPVLQGQIDALLEFDPTLNELNNGVINAAFLLMFKDLIRLFACYNDGIINLLEKYFDLNRKQCKEGLDIYKKFLVRMDSTAQFLKVAENVGIDKGDIPDLTKAPASLLEALEAHLSSLEGKKAAKLQSKAGGSASAATLSEDDKKKILADEEKELQKLKDDSGNTKPKKAKKKKKEQKLKAQAAAATMEPLSRVPTQTTQEIPPVSPPAAAMPSKPAAPSDDLLSLDTNPFQSNVESVLAASSTQQQPWTGQPVLAAQNGHGGNMTSGFASESTFASAFNTNQPQPSNAATDSLLSIDDTDTLPSQVDSAAGTSSQAAEKTTNGEAQSPPTTKSSAVKEKKPKEKKKKRDRSATEDKDRAVNAEESTEKTTAPASKMDAGEDGDRTAVSGDYMHVTIGGQKIKIKTSPSFVSALGDEKAEEPIAKSKTKKEKRSRSKSPAHPSAESKAAVQESSPTPETSAADLIDTETSASPKQPTKTKAYTPAPVQIVDLLGDSIETGPPNQLPTEEDQVCEEADGAVVSDGESSASEEQEAIDLLAELEAPTPMSGNSSTIPAKPGGSSNQQPHSDILDLFGGGSGGTGLEPSLVPAALSPNLAAAGTNAATATNELVVSTSTNLLSWDSDQGAADLATDTSSSNQPVIDSDGTVLGVEQGEVVMERSITPGMMLLPEAERCITPSPSLLIPDNNNAETSANQTAHLETADDKAKSNQSATTEPLPKQSDELETKPNTAASKSPKAAQTLPVKKPDNPLEAAMFLQMFPEEPKVVVKKSLAEMAAESSPQKSASPVLSTQKSADKSSEGDMFGQVLQPQSTAPPSITPPTSQSKLVQGDLDTSLASLAGNLSVNPGAQTKSSLQWTAPTEKKLTGGNNFSGINPASSTWASQPQQPMMTQPAWSQPQMYASYPTQPNNMFIPNQTAPMYYGAGVRPAAPAYQPMMMPGYGAPPAAPPQQQPVQMANSQQTSTTAAFDPFGSLS